MNLDEISETIRTHFPQIHEIKTKRRSSWWIDGPLPGNQNRILRVEFKGLSTLWAQTSRTPGQREAKPFNFDKAGLIARVNQELNLYWDRVNSAPPTAVAESQNGAIAKTLRHVPTEDEIVLVWQNGRAGGYTDWLPLRFFEEEGEWPDVVHDVSVGSRTYQAKCDVAVRGNEATLDYEAHAEFNRMNGMLVGVARLTFKDRDQTDLASLEWKSIDTATYDIEEFEAPVFMVPPAGPYLPPEAPAEKTAVKRRLRPGQSAFRRRLKAIYGNRCCISGTVVAEVLEGAHIDGYLNTGSDNPKNGLLLRSDLHTLFDNHLISIEPDTHLIRVAERAKIESGYARLEGIRLVLPADASHHPDPDALKRHWQSFTRKNPEWRPS